MPKVHAITYEDIGKLGVDENNNLYWDGRPVLTRRNIRLPWFVNVAAIVASLSTVVMAAIQFLEYAGVPSSRFLMW